MSSPGHGMPQPYHVMIVQVLISLFFMSFMVLVADSDVHVGFEKMSLTVAGQSFSSLLLLM